MSEPLGVGHCTRHAASKAPSPCVPPLAQCGDEGAQRWKWLLGSSPKTLPQEDDIIIRSFVHVFVS